ncbi:MAG: histidine phosphatase family protein [Simkaniaceae bacterium]|nr:histidine phosphatase family protein [Candidatus Sacchlamyda saccharinae]
MFDSFTSQPKKSLLLLRHGHREKTPKNSFGNELPLTLEGKQRAFSLGQTIRDLKIGECHTSPLLRCVQTAEKILEGSNQKIEIKNSKILGDPGPFISDPVEAGPLFLETPLESIAQAIVDNQKLPGMRTLEEGSHLFVRHVLQVGKLPCIMISHDIIISLLCCFFFKSHNAQKFMPNYLEGLSITRENSHIIVHLEKYNEPKKLGLGEEAPQIFHRRKAAVFIDTGAIC